MFLIKCSCGCQYTIPENILYDPQIQNYDRKCPACTMSHDFKKDDPIEKMHRNGYQIYRLPDDSSNSLIL